MPGELVRVTVITQSRREGKGCYTVSSLAVPCGVAEREAQPAEKMDRRVLRDTWPGPLERFPGEARRVSVGFDFI